MFSSALKELTLKLADDLLIIGHRHSEWIGLGPLLEEDISFASIAQDKVGQSRVLYNLLHQWGEPDADTQVFTRKATAYTNCTLVELPAPDYELALLRHFLFDEAQAVIFNALRSSTQPDLAAFAAKFSGEIKYHTLHARAMLKRLCAGSEEARTRIATALEVLWPYAGGIFEASPYEDTLLAEGVLEAFTALKSRWLQEVQAFLAGLDMYPEAALLNHEGGRVGQHTPYLQPMLDEMGEVYNLDPSAEW